MAASHSHTRRMTDTLHFDDAHAIPLDTDDDVLERLCSLVRNAIRRQVWLMFLDRERKQPPEDGDRGAGSGDDDAERIGDFMREVASDLDAAHVILVFERVGPPELSEPDREWMRMLAGAGERCGLPVLGPYLCHRRGVREVKAGEYL